jgi:predicted phosphoribosyltransferase
MLAVASTNALVAYRDWRAGVLAPPEGGVHVAAEVALPLRALLDLIRVRKNGTAIDPEPGAGAVEDFYEDFTEIADQQ